MNDDADDWTNMSNETLVTLYWYSDILTDDEYFQLEAELKRRKISPERTT
jgi:hypothetical protein